MKDQEILDNAPDETWVAICKYDYGDCLHSLYLNCENQFYDPDEKEWVNMCLVDNYFHSFRSRKDIREIVELRVEVEKQDKRIAKLEKALQLRTEWINNIATELQEKSTGEEK